MHTPMSCRLMPQHSLQIRIPLMCSMRLWAGCCTKRSWGTRSFSWETSLPEWAVAETYKVRPTVIMVEAKWMQMDYGYWLSAPNMTSPELKLSLDSSLSIRPPRCIHALDNGITWTMLLSVEAKWGRWESREPWEEQNAGRTINS